MQLQEIESQDPSIEYSFALKRSVFKWSSYIYDHQEKQYYTLTRKYLSKYEFDDIPLIYIDKWQRVEFGPGDWLIKLMSAYKEGAYSHILDGAEIIMIGNNSKQKPIVEEETVESPVLLESSPVEQVSIVSAGQVANALGILLARFAPDSVEAKAAAKQLILLSKGVSWQTYSGRHLYEKN